MAKTTHVVMVGNSRGVKDGNVVAVEPDVAKALIDNGHARKPYSGEVKAAEGK